MLCNMFREWARGTLLFAGMYIYEFLGLVMYLLSSQTSSSHLILFSGELSALYHFKPTQPASQYDSEEMGHTK